MYHRFIKQVPPGIISIIINASFIRFASKASSQYYQQQHKIYSSKLPPNIIIMINTRFIIFSSKTSSRYRQHRHQRKCYHKFINKFLPISSATAQDLSYVHQTLPPSVISIFIIVSSKTSSWYHQHQHNIYRMFINNFLWYRHHQPKIYHIFITKFLLV